MNTNKNDYELNFNQTYINMTSNHRPDIRWKFVDNQGHEHRWHESGESVPADIYKPTVDYDVPSTVWIKTGIGYYDDGSSFDIGEWRCISCGDVIKPKYTVDDVEQYIPSGKIDVSGWCVIDPQRGLNLLTSNRQAYLTEILRDTRDYESIAYDLPDIRARVTKFDRNVPDNVCKVWFQS